jgi:hypothetical protein
VSFLNNDCKLVSSRLKRNVTHIIFFIQAVHQFFSCCCYRSFTCRFDYFKWLLRCCLLFV